jgi:hypothetical protein
MKPVENSGNGELTQKETGNDQKDIKNVQRERPSAEQKRKKRLWHLVKAERPAACGETEPAFTKTGKEVSCHSTTPNQRCRSERETQDPSTYRSKDHRQ